ncbi:unnamed protein product [Callosobruchus maculatus]|uniref:Uncharacterized protein n=1 Tax=Callosobruchus maculatus TaxID=64391 RepID=A0A653CH73_CALMS|nr:unnamed protein product [Callosobruchus maculatus]
MAGGKLFPERFSDGGCFPVACPYARHPEDPELRCKALRRRRLKLPSSVGPCFQILHAARLQAFLVRYSKV